MKESVMAEYELMFEVDDLDDEVTEAIYEHHDALVSSHADGTTLTITAEGPTAVVAAKRIVEELESEMSTMVHRLIEDLVSRADIASRSNATPQAVGLWIRGDRRRDEPFPRRFNRVGGGVWLWGEVNEWLRRVGRSHDEHLRFPCRQDYDEVNAWILDRHSRRRISTVRARVSFPGEASLGFEAAFEASSRERPRTRVAVVEGAV